MTYITKFFYWEAGYYRTLDIILDRAGYYICWGCLVFVPGLYASPTLFGTGAVLKAVKMGKEEIIDYRLAILITVLGLFFLGANYAADEQRQRVRATNGKTKIWGKSPKLVMAKYTVRNALTKETKTQTTCLLASGLWGIARHFNYSAEICLAFCWCFSNAGFTALMPFAYFIHLTILLVHRSKRDDSKCSDKYGSAWKEYKKLVPYELIPGIF
ncbi:hypothetical protein Ciccas_001762 [Cichlidogyrus casuarinus]|uniref:7-dehydrocholesterol reductase n=1 Tax=Cichlidogyrus casuarinus TaxID=1844966 RepID=A0ABD2QJP0_9PLAT